MIELINNSYSPHFCQQDIRGHFCRCSQSAISGRSLVSGVATVQRAAVESSAAERDAFGTAGPALTRGGRSPVAVAALGGFAARAFSEHRTHCTLHSPQSTHACDSSVSSTVPSARRAFEPCAVSALAYKYEARWRGRRRTTTHRESTST